MPAKLTINPNGSIKLEGDFEIVDKQGTPYGLGGRDVVALCRCGLSKNKPFCDGSHKGHYEHEAVAFALPPSGGNRVIIKRRTTSARRKASIIEKAGVAGKDVDPITVGIR